MHLGIFDQPEKNEFSNGLLEAHPSLEAKGRGGKEGLAPMGKDSKAILDAMKVMKEFELTVAELYRTCNSLWPEDDALWKNLEQAEMRHAETVDKMISILSERPDFFEPNRLFKPAAVRTSILGIRGDIERLKRREIPKNKILFIARDLEQSVIESKYFEVVKGRDVEYQNMIEEMRIDTMAHRDELNKKIEETK